MASVLVQVADAVTKLVNDHKPDSSYTTQRPDSTYCPNALRSYGDFILDIEKADELHIDVIPVSPLATELATRGGIKYLASIDILLRYKCKQNEKDNDTGRVDQSIVDDLVSLTELFSELFQDASHRRLPGYEAATYKSSMIRTVAPGDILMQRMFTSRIRAVYSVHKEL